MKSRIVTVTLAVAMGLWAHAAWSQTEPAAADPLAPGSAFDDPLPSGLPLGELGSAVERSSAPEPPPDLSRVERDGEWIYAVRRGVSRMPWGRVALVLGALCAFLAAGWAIASTFRKRRRRAYRRLPRSAGGPRLQGLEEVVASVQLTARRATDDLRHLNERITSEAGSANPSVGARPASVKLPVDL